MKHPIEVAGTAGGTLITWLGIRSDDIAKTIVLAALGAIVSFTVTVLCKWALGKRKK